MDAIMICLFVNMLTHPLYFSARHHFFPHEFWLVGVAVFEPLVVLCEAVVFGVLLPFNRPRAFLASLISNCGSLFLGVFFHFMYNQ